MRRCRNDGVAVARTGGFTIVELLVAMAVLAIISVILAGISSQTSQLWQQGESQNQHRMKARAAVEFIGGELRQAVLSPDPAEVNTLQFVINPPTVSESHRDSIFWQAPIATDTARGTIAEVGYFVRWTPENRANLCRFFLNPGDAGYAVYTAPLPSTWVTGALLDTVAPADKASLYRGLFLENVIGLWVTARRADGTAYASGYDSRAEGNQLPASVTVSLALLDNAAARRLEVMPALVSEIKSLYGTAGDAEAFAAAPALGPLKDGLSIVSFNVNLANR